MAQRDVLDYYDQVQSQYLEMVSYTNEFDKELKAGNISQEQFDQAQSMLIKIKENYERISYIIMLLYEPNRDSKKAKYRKQNNILYKNTNNCNLEAVKAENEYALKQFRTLLKDIKENK